jgi:hypothetical protein
MYGQVFYVNNGGCSVFFLTYGLLSSSVTVSSSHVFRLLLPFVKRDCLFNSLPLFCVFDCLLVPYILWFLLAVTLVKPQRNVSAISDHTCHVLLVLLYDDISFSCENRHWFLYFGPAPHLAGPRHRVTFAGHFLKCLFYTVSNRIITDMRPTGLLWFPLVVELL